MYFKNIGLQLIKCPFSKPAPLFLYKYIHKQDISHTLIYLVKAFQSSVTRPEVIYKNGYSNPVVILHKSKHKSQGGAKMWFFMYILEV